VSQKFVFPWKYNRRGVIIYTR